MQNLKLPFKQNPKRAFKVLPLFLSVVATFSLAGVRFADAAEFSVASDRHDISAGDEWLVKVSLASSDEAVNAIAGKIIFPADLLKVKEIRDGGSLINLWIERPSVSVAGVIQFSGITPGGYRGPDAPLFSVVFSSLAEGSGIIGIREAEALKNDSKGSAVAVKSSPFRFSVSPAASAVYSVPAIEDNEPPEAFRPEIVRDPNLFGGKPFLVFSTEDKKSGIDHYEVCFRSQKNCVRAESPWFFGDVRTWPVFVKAIDKRGNERVERVPSEMSPLQNYAILGIIIVAGLLIWRRWRNKNA